MPKSVIVHGTDFTKGCKTCPFWKDGSDGGGFGCGIPAPISECRFFMEMCKEEEAKEGGEDGGKTVGKSKLLHGTKL